MAHAVNKARLIKRFSVQQVLEIAAHLVFIFPVPNLLLHILKHADDFDIGPPCFGPFREARAAAIQE